MANEGDAVNMIEEKIGVMTSELTGVEGFNAGLYQDHIEEVSFLYEQRLTLFSDPEITWLDIEDFEERFEPHIDGLVVGEDVALDVCRELAEEDDAGALHAAIRVFCRQNRKDLVFNILDALDPEDGERITAVGDALKFELPAAWQDDCVKMLTDEDQKLVLIMAGVTGFRRLNAGKELFQAMQKSDTVSLPVIIWALGRLRERGAGAVNLRHCLDHENDAVCSATALALLRMGDQSTLDNCLGKARSHTWPFIPLGLGGNPATVPALLEVAFGGNVNADCLISLGLLGDIKAVDILISHLLTEELAESAAMALHLITGAELYEDAHIPEEIEEDELFEEELEDLKKGIAPTRPDGEPFGSTIRVFHKKRKTGRDGGKSIRATSTRTPAIEAARPILQPVCWRICSQKKCPV